MERLRLRRRGAVGFSLVEVMIVIAILGILATLAISSGVEMNREQRHRTLAREVYRLLSIARGSAVSENRRAAVVFGADRVTAFVDLSVPANYEYDAGTDRLVDEYPRSPDTFLAGMAVSVISGFASVSGVPTAIFDSQGYSRNESLALAPGVVGVTDDQRGDSISIRVTIGGSVRVE